MMTRTIIISLVFLHLLFRFSVLEALDCCSDAIQPTPALSAEDLNKFLDDLVPGLMKQEKIPGVAVVFVQNGNVILSRGFGYSDLDQKKHIDPRNTIFPIGSITKVFTATALVQLADQKKLDLNADVNKYLKKLKVPQKFSQPITAAHLLNHTSGLDEIRPGTQAGSPDSILPLAQFLKNRLVPVHPPGLITSYSTYGITLAGLLIEEITGLPFEVYLRRNLWELLDMSSTHISTPPQTMSHVATGYAIENGTPKKVDYEWYHTLPASSIRSTTEDMGNFVIAHLTCGKFQEHRILSRNAVCQMHRTQSTTHPNMPGWTYGFQEDDKNGLQILEHGGDIGGFSSLLVLLPDQNTGFFIAHHVEGANLRFTLKEKFLDRYFPDKRSVSIPVPTPDFADKLKRFAGLYRANLFCHTCKDPIPVPQVEVTANEDGTITVWDDRWIEVSPLLFMSLDGKRKIGFLEEKKTGRILQMSAGSWKVLEKVR